MSKAKSKNELYEVIHNYFQPSAGQIPVLIVDTGTLIDLEEIAKQKRSGEAPHKIAGKFFSNLGNMADYVIFTRGIYNEVMEHGCKGRKNGRSEIGKEICDLTERYHHGSKCLLEELNFDYHYSESYHVEVDKLQEIIKSLHEEVNGGKKGGKKVNGKDPISENDLELVNSAIKLAVKSLFEFRLRQEKSGDVPSAIGGTYRTAVISPDSHIYRPINAFITRPEGVSYRDYLQAFNPREYI